MEDAGARKNEILLIRASFPHNTYTGAAGGAEDKLKDGLVAGKMLGIVAFAFSTADPHLSTCAFKRYAREESDGEEVCEGRTLLI